MSVSFSCSSDIHKQTNFSRNEKTIFESIKKIWQKFTSIIADIWQKTLYFFYNYLKKHPSASSGLPSNLVSSSSGSSSASRGLPANLVSSSSSSSSSSRGLPTNLVSSSFSSSSSYRRTSAAPDYGNRTVHALDYSLERLFKAVSNQDYIRVEDLIKNWKRPLITESEKTKLAQALLNTFTAHLRTREVGTRFLILKLLVENSFLNLNQRCTEGKIYFHRFMLNVIYDADFHTSFYQYFLKLFLLNGANLNEVDSCENNYDATIRKSYEYIRNDRTDLITKIENVKYEIAVLQNKTLLFLTGKLPNCIANIIEGYLYSNKFTISTFSLKSKTNTKPLDRQVYEAAKIGDLLEIRELIEQGASLNYRNKNGNTPLFIATLHGHPNVVEFLIRQDVDTSLKGVGGFHRIPRAYTPLLRLLSKGCSAALHSTNILIMHSLLEDPRADMRFRTPDEETPFSLIGKWLPKQSPSRSVDNFFKYFLQKFVCNGGVIRQVDKNYYLRNSKYIKTVQNAVKNYNNSLNTLNTYLLPEIALIVKTYLGLCNERR